MLLLLEQTGFSQCSQVLSHNFIYVRRQGLSWGQPSLSHWLRGLPWDTSLVTWQMPVLHLLVLFCCCWLFVCVCVFGGRGCHIPICDFQDCSNIPSILLLVYMAQETVTGMPRILKTRTGISDWAQIYNCPNDLWKNGSFTLLNEIRSKTDSLKWLGAFYSLFPFASICFSFSEA